MLHPFCAFLNKYKGARFFVRHKLAKNHKNEK